MIGAERRNVWRRNGKRKAGDEFVAAILVDALLVFIGDAQAPILSEIVFVVGAGLQRIRRVVIGIEERALTAVCAAGAARGIGGERMNKPGGGCARGG